ncbi:unnamed protein product [Orchesella dallaii]|uniref:Ig-like domain-containing protein n=1 Tax=Orchesella dallaii TaxID=48710 RepID=A0ABP1RMK5_9HEXA
MGNFSKTIYLFILLANCCQDFAQRTPTISLISQEQIKNIGGTVELECSVQYAHDYPVLWIRLDKETGQHHLTISSGSTLIIRDSRFNLHHESGTSLYTLQVKELQETDAGTYQCQILIGVNNRVTAEIDVRVRIPPVISDNSTRSLVVSEGDEVTLECYASGFPTPKISWRRENNDILPTGGSIYRENVMKIDAVKKEHRGTYYCVAENSVGRGSRRNIAVEVEFAPVISVPRPRVGQALQYNMDLQCHVVAYPPPAITWLHNDVVLSNNQRYKISHFATADEYTDTTLRAISIEKRQYGRYWCKAANKLGVAEAAVELFETIVPICPPACGVTYYGGAVSISATFSMILLAFFATLVRTEMRL